MSARLAPASDAQAAAMWPSLAAAHLFEGPERFAQFRAEGPWRVLVTVRGEAALVERWREHLDILALRGLWCSERRVPALVASARLVAEERGFTRLLSPVVPEGAAEPYERAGMKVVQSLTSWRCRPSSVAVSADPPPDMTLRPCVSAEDLDALLAVDGECFEEFWRSDAGHMRRYSAAGRVTVAERGGAVLGYTQCAVRGQVGTLGRLAVAPEARGAGLGMALLAHAVRRAAEEGATEVSLCTQEHNNAARRLYARAGFREAPGRMVLLMSTVRA